MSVLASRSLGFYEALFFFNTERSSLPVGGTLGPLERFFQLGDAFGLNFELLTECSVLAV
jgi:hypothetical protein